MPAFTASGPVSVEVHANSGDIRLIAGDRADVTVEVRPRDPSSEADVRSARDARVDFVKGELTVLPAKFGLLGHRMGGVDVTIEVPSRSRVYAAVASARVTADGEFSDVTFESASGDLTVTTVDGALTGSTASGSVTVEDLRGRADFQTSSGTLAIRHLHGDVAHRAASGSAIITSAAAGHVVAHTSSGEVEVGVPEGTAARLDVESARGRITNALPAADGPADSDETLEVVIRTASGDVSIRRAAQRETA